jgi:hypothetical protein
VKFQRVLQIRWKLMDNPAGNASLIGHEALITIAANVRNGWKADIRSKTIVEHKDCGEEER